LTGSSIIPRLGTVAAVWLWAAGAAWAGDGGGGNVETIQSLVLDPLCVFLGMTSCPQLPTVAQVVLETAALENVPPNFVRSQIIGVSQGLDLTSGACTVAGNFGFVPCDTLSVNAVNAPMPSSVGLSELASLTPIAFKSPTSGQLLPVPLGTSGENSFFYAVVDPARVHLFFDFVPWTTKQFVQGQLAASIAFPMVVLNADGSERPVAATLQLIPTCNGAAECLSANVTGNFAQSGTQTYSAAQLGIQISFSFGATPNSTVPHGTFDLQFPLVVTGPTNSANCGRAISSGTPDPADCGNDPAYFGVIPLGATLPNGTLNPNVGSPTFINQASGLPTAFSTDVLGFTSNALGLPVGTAPYAAPACPGRANTPCPSSPPATYFGICASFSNSSFSNRLGVATFLAIGTDSATYVSSPVPGPVVALPQCPPLPQG